MNKEMKKMLYQMNDILDALEEQLENEVSETLVNTYLEMHIARYNLKLYLGYDMPYTLKDIKDMVNNKYVIK